MLSGRPLRSPTRRSLRPQRADSSCVPRARRAIQRWSVPRWPESRRRRARSRGETGFGGLNAPASLRPARTFNSSSLSAAPVSSRVVGAESSVHQDTHGCSPSPVGPWGLFGRDPGPAFGPAPRFDPQAAISTCETFNIEPSQLSGEVSQVIFPRGARAGRIAVAMSGGVDSAVALLRAAPNAIGVTLRLWLDPAGPSSERRLLLTRRRDRRPRDLPPARPPARHARSPRGVPCDRRAAVRRGLRAGPDPEPVHALQRRASGSTRSSSSPSAPVPTCSGPATTRGSSSVTGCG